jgi:hypothetical protein
MSASTKGFFAMTRSTFESKAFRGLSVMARAAYLEVGVLFFGSNNGDIAVPPRRLADRLGVGETAASGALRELVEAGILEITTPASNKLAARYRLMDRPCDMSGCQAGQKSNVVQFPSPRRIAAKPKLSNGQAKDKNTVAGATSYSLSF